MVEAGSSHRGDSGCWGPAVHLRVPELLAVAVPVGDRDAEVVPVVTHTHTDLAAPSPRVGVRACSHESP